jgi:prepilin-type N-terminal cleavage/methylation domain-containing protein
MHKSATSFGFTMIELLIVLVIIGVTALIAAPSIAEWGPYYRLKGDASTIAGMLTSARFEAVKREEVVVVSFNVAGETITMFEDANQNGTQQVAEPTISTYQLRRAVDFGLDPFVIANTQGGSVPGSAVTFPADLVSFSPNGAANPTGEVYLYLDPGDIVDDRQDFAVDVSAAGNVRYLRWSKINSSWE